MKAKLYDANFTKADGLEKQLVTDFWNEHLESTKEENHGDN